MGASCFKTSTENLSGQMSYMFIIEICEKVIEDNIVIPKKEMEKFIKENKGKHFCECGCGQKIIIRPNHYRNGIPKRLYGHHLPHALNIPYSHELTEKLKEQIRERDNRTCQLCGKTQKKGSRKFDVHHINYDPENNDPKLITLCRKCHCKTNYNKDFWTDILMHKIRRSGNLIQVTFMENIESC